VKSEELVLGIRGVLLFKSAAPFSSNLPIFAKAKITFLPLKAGAV